LLVSAGRVDRLGQYLFVDRSSCYLFSD
jgi:hypothetical protein